MLVGTWGLAGAEGERAGCGAGRVPGVRRRGATARPATGLRRGQKARPRLPARSPYRESPWAQLAAVATAHQLGAAQGPGVAVSGPRLLLNGGQGHTWGQEQGAGGAGGR